MPGSEQEKHGFRNAGKRTEGPEQDLPSSTRLCRRPSPARTTPKTSATHSSTSAQTPGGVTG